MKEVQDKVPFAELVKLLYNIYSKKQGNYLTKAAVDKEFP